MKPIETLLPFFTFLHQLCGTPGCWVVEVEPHVLLSQSLWGRLSKLFARALGMAASGTKRLRKRLREVNYAEINDGSIGYEKGAGALLFRFMRVSRITLCCCACRESAISAHNGLPHICKAQNTYNEDWG